MWCSVVVPGFTLVSVGMGRTEGMPLRIGGVDGAWHHYNRSLGGLRIPVPVLTVIPSFSWAHMGSGPLPLWR